MIRSTLMTFLFAITSSAICATLPPERPQDAVTWPATLKQAATKGFSLGDLQVRFEETTLAEVARSAATGSIAHHSDAGNSVYWLCYTISEPKSQRIWVISNEEMGGSEHAITGMIASRLNDVHPQGDCPALPAHLRPVSLDVRVWLGSSSTEVRDALGAPSNTAGEWREFDFQGKVPGNCEGGYDLLNSLSVKLKKGRVNMLVANQVTSC